jgi:hypothetical protein
MPLSDSWWNLDPEITMTYPDVEKRVHCQPELVAAKNWETNVDASRSSISRA